MAGPVIAQGGENCSQNTSVSFNVSSPINLVKLHSRTNWPESFHTTSVNVSARGGLLFTGPHYELRVRLQFNGARGNFDIIPAGGSSYINMPAYTDMTLAHGDVARVAVRGEGNAGGSLRMVTLSLNKLNSDNRIRSPDYDIRGQTNWLLITGAIKSVLTSLFGGKFCFRPFGQPKPRQSCTALSTMDVQHPRAELLITALTKHTRGGIDRPFSCL